MITLIEIGIATAISFPSWDIEKAFGHVSRLGYKMVEIGAGGIVSACHFPEGRVESVLEGKANEYKKSLRNIISKFRA